MSGWVGKFSSGWCVSSNQFPAFSYRDATDMITIHPHLKISVHWLCGYGSTGQVLGNQPWLQERNAFKDVSYLQFPYLIRFIKKSDIFSS